MPLRARMATEGHAEHKCSQGCGAKIWKGQPVVVLQQGSHVPYDVRMLVFHVSCVQDIMPSTPIPEATTESEAIRDIVAIYYALGQRVS